MKALHIRTEGMHDENESAFCEMLVRFVDGVHDVASVRTLHLISVLYDEAQTSDARILSAIRRAGFEAHLYAAPSASRELAATGSRP